MSFSRDQLRAAYEQACRREIEALKDDPAAVEKQGAEIKARYARLFKV